MPKSWLASHLISPRASAAAAFLAKQGRSRRIALTLPNFMLALAVIAETDLISALPRAFVAMHAERFGVVSREAPLQLSRFRGRAVVPKVAMMDAGLAWLYDLLPRTKLVAGKRARRAFARKPRSVPDGLSTVRMT